ncbi:aspartyl protease family protein, partial [Sphingomonas solaris]
AAPEPPPPLAPAMLDDGLEVTGDPLAARRMAARMAVPVRVNGTGPYRFVVDSGADRSVIGTALAARLGLPAGDPARLHDTAGTSRVETVRIDRLDVGDSMIEDIAAPSLPEHFIGADGLLGIDALAGQRLMLDYERRTITVEDARTPAPAMAEDEIVVTARRHKGQLILTRVAIDGTDVYAVIDSGAELTMGNSALLARVLRGRRPPPEEFVTLVSVTGQAVVARQVTLPELHIGGLILEGVRVAFTDAPPFALFGLSQRPAMLLGSDVLEAFRRVSLDFRQRKVRFVMRR